MEIKEKNGEIQYATIFSEIINSAKNAEDRSKDRLRSEARTLVSAGTDTTATTLTIAMYHILANADILATLKAELLEAVPDPSSMPSLSTLENLPYLSAVIAESQFSSQDPMISADLRYLATRHYSLTSRSPRISHENIIYTNPSTSQTYLIPAGTPMGTSIYNLHRDPLIFPDPDSFVPPRWLPDPSTGSAPTVKSSPSPSSNVYEGKPLKTYLVPFSKGSRNCLGMHLANAQLYIALASLVRRCDLELWETGEEEVRAEHDFFLPFPKEGGKGVRVKVV
jgi:cytochrome P450